MRILILVIILTIFSACTTNTVRQQDSLDFRPYVGYKIVDKHYKILDGSDNQSSNDYYLTVSDSNVVINLQVPYYGYYIYKVGDTIK